MSNTPTTHVSIPSPVQSPMTPRADDDRAANIHSSPSFDYHEERRLHLKDEIWLSHHLPRIPPSSIPASVTSSPRASDDASTSRAKAATGSTIIPSSNGGSVDTAPSTSIPRPLSTKPHATANGDMGLGIGVGQNLLNGGSGMSMSSSSAAGGDDTDEGQQRPNPHLGNMISPSEDGSMDPTPTLIHRKELDEQERLDLEAEKRERMISEGLGDLAAGSIEPESREGGDAGDVEAAKAPVKGEFQSLLHDFISIHAWCLAIAGFLSRHPCVTAVRQGICFRLYRIQRIAPRHR